MIEFWIVRKGEDPWKVAPEVSDGISAHPDNGNVSSAAMATRSAP